MGTCTAATGWVRRAAISSLHDRPASMCRQGAEQKEQSERCAREVQQAWIWQRICYAIGSTLCGTATGSVDKRAQILSEGMLNTQHTHTHKQKNKTTKLATTRGSSWNERQQQVYNITITTHNILFWRLIKKASGNFNSVYDTQCTDFQGLTTVLSFMINKYMYNCNVALSGLKHCIVTLPPLGQVPLRAHASRRSS